MSEPLSPPSQDQEALRITAEIAAQNGNIAEQNSRVLQVGEIQDTDFREIALQGIAQEQRASATTRAELAVRIDYDEISKRQSATSQLIAEIALREQQLEADLAKNEEQAALSARLSPSVAEQVGQLAAQKAIPLQEELAAARADKASQLEAEAEFFEMVGAAWPVPVALEHEVVVEPAAVPSPEPDVPHAGSPQGSEPAQPDSPESDQPATGEEDILKSVVWSVVEYVSGREEVRLEVMRKELAELAQLSQEEYEYFKQHFEELRQLIKDTLAARGLNVSWEKWGKARGTRYRLLEHLHPREDVILGDDNKSAPATPRPNGADTTFSGLPDNIDADDTGDPDVPSVNSLNHELTPEEIAELPITITTLALISNRLILNNLPSLKRTYLAREIANEFGIDPADAGFMLSKLVKAGLVYEDGNHKGTALLSTRRPESSPEPPAPAKPEKKGKEVNHEERIKGDLDVARKLLEELAGKRHLTEGIRADKFNKEISSTMPDIQDGSISRLKELGVIVTVKSNQTGGPHSTKREVWSLRFASQQVKEDWKKDPKKFIEDLELRMIEQIVEQ